VEIDPDEFYNVTPDYFEWDDLKSGGVYRRMIQRFSRRLVNQQPAFTYEWIGCTAAQVLTEIEQQLSMLVQGLVKARSDAVDGDGAMALPWLRWTNELTIAVVLQMELNVHELDQSTVDFQLTSELVTERATSEMAPFQLLTKDPTSASASPLTILSLGHECSVCHLLVPGDDSTNVAQNFTCMSCGKSNLSVRVWLANPRHPLIRDAQQQLQLDFDRASKVVQRLDETTLTPVKSGSRVTYDSRIILVKQCTTPGCGEYCDAVSNSSQKCTRCSSALASEAGYFVINPTAVLSSTLSQGLQVQPPTRQMLVMTAMKFSESEQLGQQSSTMLKYFPFWPITDNEELNKAKQLGLGAVSGSHSLKHIKSLQQRIETVIKGIDGTASAKYQIIKYLDSGGLTSRSDRYDQQRHMVQALVDSDLMDLFAAAMRGKLLLMDDSNDQNS
jgi:hypothetical protein